MAIVDKITDSQVWKSVFRHPMPKDRRNRVVVMLTNFFLHLHPVSVKKQGIALSYTWCMGGTTFFLFMGGLAAVLWAWTYFRLPETLALENRRPLSFSGITASFKLVVTNRAAFAYGLAGTFLFGALFGFISSSQQIYVDIYGLGVYFPVAFAAMAGLMAISSFTNSKIVRRFGMRRL